MKNALIIELRCLDCTKGNIRESYLADTLEDLKRNMKKKTSCPVCKQNRRFDIIRFSKLNYKLEVKENDKIDKKSADLNEFG